MPQENDEKRPVEGQRPQPEIGARLKQKFLRPLEFNLFILEQGTKEEDLKGQSRDDPSCGRRTVNLIGFDPGKRFLLTADRGDMEGNR